nr:putative integron gene cassette protein [uncultured bacterium]
MTFSLVPCDQNGTPIQPIPDMPEALVVSCQATADLYRRVGFITPWIGYVAVVDNRDVGGGAFVGPPKDGHVEIAYFTLENEQHKGYASQTAVSLVAIARAHTAEIGLKAFTLKEENPSTKILRSLGFSIIGVSQDDDAGQVWEWRA